MSQRPPSSGSRPRSGGARQSPSSPAMARGRLRRRAEHQPNYMMRRILVLVALVAIVGFLLWGILLFAGAVSGGSEDTLSSGAAQSLDASQSGVAQSDGAQSSAQIVSGHPVPPGGEATKDGIVDAQGEITIPECLMSDIRLTADSQQVAVGAGATIPVTVDNVGGVACAFRSQAIRAVITSGDDLYFDTAQCPEEEAPLLLLTPDKQWKDSVVWDGRRHQGCEPASAAGDGQADVAQAGTYRVKITLGEAAEGLLVNLILE